MEIAVKHTIQHYAGFMIPKHFIEKSGRRAPAHHAAVSFNENGTFLVDHILAVYGAVRDPKGLNRPKRVFNKLRLFSVKLHDRFHASVYDVTRRCLLFMTSEHRGQCRHAVSADRIHDILFAENTLLQEQPVFGFAKHILGCFLLPERVQ